jgi:peptidoglycan hydrolase CwlO-like protein
MAKYLQTAIKSIERQIADYQQKAEKESEKQAQAKAASEYWLYQIDLLKNQIQDLKGDVHTPVTEKTEE